jgi:TonB family protein
MSIRNWRTTCGAVILLALITIVPLCAQEAAENGRTILKRVQPQYPALAQRMSIKGTVKLEVIVEQDGTVKSMSAKGGHPVLVDAAQQAIRGWRWKPGSQETRESIEIRFNPN